ncbi:MAG: response regulator transcription factor [Bacteroidaceae bacterium]|nr:response regulator transcription factor [Bacteroidaceae bacterium]MDY4998284.1 response regulator transcription factor [Bacteroidaceae bacterium]MDY5961674.1 response regulator transcription factor [Bacteroidaceae bacterium]
MRILVVDDEQDLCEILQYNLETEGYEVHTANSAEEALRLPLENYDLILLDVMMGQMSGFQMALKMKENPVTSQVPIIFITALEGEDSLVRGLNIGADDYMVKPLSLREVKARIKAVLRRSMKNEIQEKTASDCYSFQGLCINREAKSASIDGQPLQLTKLEYEMLSLLLSNMGKAFSREEMLEHCWPKDAIVLDRTVDVNINRLRKKVGPYGKYIKTRVGFGYTFEG